jgi:exonuclease SbcC
MEILSVVLKNFKAHSDRHFNFQPGTNAICGENGAGKTSILEAIAWALFDYTGDYNKDDLVRNGAASAQVRIHFVSSRDGRTYEIQRCTSKSYTLYDPQINERLPYSRIKEEVLPWLRQHLGVAPGTDLAQLFSSTIGVPQGTFTADFLLTKERRKPIFDRILKVEEYQQTWKKLADLEKYAKAQVEGLERDIARYQEELGEFEGKKLARQAQQQEIAQVQAELEQTQAQLAILHQEQDQLSALAMRSQQLDTELTQLTLQTQTQTKNLERLQADLQQAEAAAGICITNRQAFQTFQQAETSLRELEQQRQLEQKLQQQKRQQEKQLGDRQTKLATLTLQLSRLAEAQAEIERLHPLAQQQSELEQAQQALSQQLQHCLSLRQQIKQQEKQLAQLQTRQTQLTQEITQIRALATTIQEIPTLEQQQQRIQQQLSRVAAATQFEADLQQLLAQTQTMGDRFLSQAQQATITLQNLQQAVPAYSPALAEILTVLQSGNLNQQQLITALQGILADLADQTSTDLLEQHLQDLQTKLKNARQQQARFANLERLIADDDRLQQEQTDLHTHLEQLRHQLGTEATLQAQQAELATELTTLNNPKARIQVRQEELRQSTTLNAQFTKVESELAEITQAIVHLDQQLTAYADLTEQVQTQQQVQDDHRDAYQTYMAHRELANTRKLKQQQVQEATQELQTLAQHSEELQQERADLRQSFDPEQFQAVQTAYQSANHQQIALSARLPDMLKVLAALDQELTRLEALQEKQAIAQTNLAQKRKTEKFIKFARKAYKEAGPRITERYIHSISREADKLFRELLNRTNVSLQWTRDYEILIQEGAHSRRFVNLSGGEQMCAALAVRLALLKILADIDIAFFDEPTTNMDKARREQLADAIANIKTFRQLFVISHDDTFEKVTENIILVEREN